MKDKVSLMWLRDIPDDHKNKFKEDLGHFRNGPIFDRLRAILGSEESRLNSQRLSVEAFDSPNWAQKQAFVNGQLSVLRLIKDLLS